MTSKNGLGHAAARPADAPQEFERRRLENTESTSKADVTAIQSLRVASDPPKKMTQSFLGREDLTLESKLNWEISRILNWSLDGLERLRARGRFIQPKSALTSTRKPGGVTGR